MADYLNDYAHLREVAVNVGSVLSKLQPCLHDFEDRGLVLLVEGKLGRLLGAADDEQTGGPPPRFDVDVGSAAFCAILQMLESFPRWNRVTNWEETQEVYFTVVLPRDVLNGLEEESRPVEVRSTVRTMNGLAVSHIAKKRIEHIDMAIQNVDAGACALGTCSQFGATIPLDARISISLAKFIPDTALPLAVCPKRVRIKQSKTFFLSSLGVAKECYSFELGVTYEGRTKTEAESKQSKSEGATYEVLLSCLAPKEYLETSGDPICLALSVILKLLDFAAALNPNSSVSFAPAKAAS